MHTARTIAIVHALRVLESDAIIADLTTRNRELEALLAAERDRSRSEHDARVMLEEQHAFARRELEGLRKSYAILQQQHELLRRQIFEAKAERIDPRQLELELEQTKAALDEMQARIAEVTGESPDDLAPPPEGKTRNKPTGRRKLDVSAMVTERLELPDPAMEALVESGEAEVIGADESTRLVRRRATMVCLVVARLTYRMKKDEQGSTLVTAEAPAQIIERSIGTPSLYAAIATDKHDRSMPLYRQEERFEQEGVPLDRGTMSRWMNELGGTLGATLLHVMKQEAMATAMCLNTDATGILVQQGRDPTTGARRACKKGHYFVQIADRDAVFFEYTERETSAAVMELFRGFEGYVQSDAKNVFDILFREPDEPPDPDIEPDGCKRTAVGCWSHARRYFFEAAATAKEPVAREALFRIRRLFEMDARFCAKGTPPSKRKTLRDQFLAPELDLFFVFARAELEKVKGQRGLLRSALVYITNQEDRLRAFLADGRLKMDNNSSERALRKVAIGRKNYLFVGSDDHAQSAANLMSIIATAKLHDIEPEEYLRDIFRVLPHWPRERYLELAPKYWRETRAKLDKAELAAELGHLTVPPTG